MSAPGTTMVKRPERFTRLAGLCPAIADALKKKGMDGSQVFMVIRDGVSLECKECGTIVRGEELYVLSQPLEGSDLNVRMRRMRLGFCPNPDCKSYDCTMTFAGGDQLDWTDCLHHADQMVRMFQRFPTATGKRWPTHLLRPALITIFAVLLALLVRQLYFGGRIPLLREPEKFRVDPAPEGAGQVD